MTVHAGHPGFRGGTGGHLGAHAGACSRQGRGGHRIGEPDRHQRISTVRVCNTPVMLRTFRADTTDYLTSIFLSAVIAGKPSVKKSCPAELRKVRCLPEQSMV